MNKQCEQCDITFSARRRYNRFCSVACSNKWKGANLPVSKNAFKTGSRPWNTGTNKSGMSGKSHTAESKMKIRKANTGASAPNWKGGLTTENYRIRRSEQYAYWRKQVFERDGYACQHCGVKSITGRRVRIEADHIKPFATHKDLRFEVSNGRTLCEACHRKTPTWGATGQKAIHEATGKTFDEMAPAPAETETEQ
ncbi:MAG TPA: HNH endonuclease [Zoogloea sp.]|nr:HNH endonuclease [Zoogloea sp.]